MSWQHCLEVAAAGAEHNLVGLQRHTLHDDGHVNQILNTEHVKEKRNRKTKIFLNHNLEHCTVNIVYHNSTGIFNNMNGDYLFIVG